MKVLFVGNLRPGRTGYHRFLAAQRLGHEVVPLDTSAAARPRGLTAIVAKIALRLDHYVDHARISERLDCLSAEFEPQVIWLDKVLMLSPRILTRVRERGAKVIFYHPDDFRSQFNWSRAYNACPEVFNLIATTKSYNIPEFRGLGFDAVLFVDNSFEPTEHRPPPDSDPSQPRRMFSCGVGFVGGYEPERAEIMIELARRGVQVEIRGSFWDRASRPLPTNVVVVDGDLGAGSYAEQLYHTKINLAFLRKVNRDLQTTRSFEIPASGGFMLSERTNELEALFKPGVEAEFFTSIDELEDKCRYYLEHPAEREAIASAGHRRVWEGGFRSDDIVAKVLQQIV